jgi:hypothetical protein
MINLHPRANKNAMRQSFAAVPEGVADRTLNFLASWRQQSGKEAFKAVVGHVLSITQIPEFAVS